MLFNPGKVRDFMAHFPIYGNDLELVEENKLLGVIVSSNLSLSSNVEYVVKRCNSKLWILRLHKKLGADNEDLKEVYVSQIRSILEFEAPVSHSSITGEDRLKLERLQKSALHIMLSNSYKSFSYARKALDLETLHTRRQKLCKKFARKSCKNEKFRK